MKLWLVVLGIMSVGVVIAEPSPEWQERSRIAKTLDIGESAPDWLVNSETYAFGNNDWDALAESKVAFVTHCPINREYFARCHALGIRCFPYVTFYQGFASMTYEGVNLKDHPEFIEVDEAGNLTRTGFWTSEDAKNMYTTCPNVQAYQDAMVEWVHKIIEMGADGVFVDNLCSRTPCFGPKFGKHEHVYEDQNHAFAMLLKRVRDVVKELQPEGAVLGNSANPPSLPKEFWKYLDAEMLESYICTWVSTERWFDWTTHWNQVGKDLQPYVKAGKQIQALSYLGHTPYGIREDAFFCYSSARLAGFVWSGGALSNPDMADLYRMRLGTPLSDELEENGVHYRVFERGMVAVNPDKEKPASITLLPPIPVKRLLDVFGGGLQAWQPSGKIRLSTDTGVKHGGGKSLVCENASAEVENGAHQTLVLNQETPAPITVCGWSKAENVSGDPDANYSLYADITYKDGTFLYGQIAPFAIGSHDWEFASVTITPEKAVAQLTLHALFRYKTGKVWFDDLSLREENGLEQIVNGGFEDISRESHMLDLTETGILEIPAYSGRVYLFTAGTQDELSKPGPRLTVITSPALGEVRFRVDGFDYWTYSGRWTTEYVLGPDFGKFHITFDAPGKHTIEIVDTVPANMKTPAGYGSGERLGQFMDPSNPTQNSAGKKFTFREWEGYGPATSIEVDVSQSISITALFDVEQGTP
ncbi:MAG TPA: putative glycoside hydrolase [Candidatus Hydrogenedentes bacterium]|nr:putative glycoside hydrolase [Candidatus Hydrogenedentota bacterium]